MENVQVDSNITLTSSISCITFVHYIFGINIRSKLRGNFTCNVLFGIHLVLGFAYFICACLKAEIDSADIKIWLFSVHLVASGVGCVAYKLSYRRSSHNLRILIKTVDTVLTKFQGKEQPFLKRVQTAPKFILLFYFFIVIVLNTIVFLSCRGTERTETGEYRSAIGSENYQKLNQKYRINFIFHMYVVPLNYVSFSVATVLLFSTCAAFIFILNQLMLMDHTEIDKFLSIHHNVRRLLHQANKAFGSFILIKCGTSLINIFAFGRNFKSDLKRISWNAFLVLFVTEMFAHLAIISQVDYKFKASLGHLQRMGYQMLNEMERNRSHRRALITLPPKIDLYVTYVTLEDPCITLGGIMKIKYQTIIATSSFILCYMCIFFDK